MSFPISNYNYYPATAIELANISYKHVDDIPDDVAQIKDMTCLWVAGNTVAQLFIARNVVTSEIWVVIKGTYFGSPTSWGKEDLDIGTGKQFISLEGFDPMEPIVFPSAVEISEGTFNGMNYLYNLQNEDEVNYIAFLQNLVNNYPDQVTNIYVTGHSLGGTLTPAMYLYLLYMIYGMKPEGNMAMWSFAGLTAGGTTFNDYLSGFIPEDINWRLVNDLDVAPLLWTNLQAVQDIYVNPSLGINLPIDTMMNDFFTDYFNKGAASGLDYAQPANSEQSMTGTFVDGESWLGELMAQHHISTYQTLVHNNFPYSAS